MSKYTRKEIKAAEKIVDKLFHELATGIQFNIFNLGKITRPTESIYLETKSEDQAREEMKSKIQIYREN